jgi:hypothetical protein
MFLRKFFKKRLIKIDASSMPSIEGQLRLKRRSSIPTAD